MDTEELEEFTYEFHERVLGIEPDCKDCPEEKERPEWDWIGKK